MSPQDVAKGLLSYSPEQLANMDHATLYAARAYVPQTQQNLIAPYEHQAFAREAVADNPLMALPVAAGTVLYPFYKMVNGARSEPSVGEVGRGLLGVAQGVWNGYGQRLGLLNNN